jgi:hypothetical protein
MWLCYLQVDGPPGFPTPSKLWPSSGIARPRPLGRLPAAAGFADFMRHFDDQIGIWRRVTEPSTRTDALWQLRMERTKDVLLGART